MPRPVILISSCKRDVDNGANQAIRDTWGNSLVIPHFFCLGRGNKPTWRDEILFQVGDDYLSLSFKTRNSLKLALDDGYTHVFRAFTDTFIDVERLLASGFEAHDYAGNFKEGPDYTFAHGGPGYWLSRKAIRILLAAKLIPHKYPNDKFEDQWVGRALHGANIARCDDKRYSMGKSYGMQQPAVLQGNDTISEHLSTITNQYDHDWMQQVYATRYGLNYTAKVERLEGCNCSVCRARSLRLKQLKAQGTPIEGL